MYKKIIRPLLFLMEPEKAHRFLFHILSLYRHLPPLRSIVRRACYPETVSFCWEGLTFKNRIGLSAGFDKAGENFDELSDFGFAFIELGTVTPQAEPGNSGPRIFRLPQDRSLISRTGFNNPGMGQVDKNLLRRKPRGYYLGLNINKNVNTRGDAVVDDFFLLYRRFYHKVDYFTLNWGSVDEVVFGKILDILNEYRQSQTEKRPFLIKLPADIQLSVLDQVLELGSRYQVDGYIATGPSQDRSGLSRTPSALLEKIGTGGVSGKAIGDKSLNIVRYLAAHKMENTLLIGAGGVMTPASAGEMLKAGADLVQIYSSFIYEGPGVVKQMAEFNFNK